MNNKLYRRNNQGTPCYWYAFPTTDNTYCVHHGIVGGANTISTLTTTRKAVDEVASKYKAKRKQGYKYLEEIRDDSSSTPVEGHALFDYLNTYLPYDRTTASGTLLHMLAKKYSDTVFNKVPTRLGQYKINGLRCFISAKRNYGDIFMPFKLVFQSREGTHWNSLNDLEEYLLTTLPVKTIKKMIEEDWILDGEIYLPGYNINEINHFVKDSKCLENRLLQFWCYDIAIQDMIQYQRIINLHNIEKPHVFNSVEEHFNNKDRFVVLPTFEIDNHYKAKEYRDLFINYKFEGLILRDPNAEYQFGKRNNTMIKYKTTTDGIFEILDIYKEGVKRDIPLFLCRNDINNATFEVHINGTMDYQRNILDNKDKYIGKKLFITFGERSGIEKVPFHVKEVKLHNE